MSRRETEFPNEPHTVGDLMSETAMAGEIGALCETLRDDLPLRIEYRMQAAEALTRLNHERAAERERREAVEGELARVAKVKHYLKMADVEDPWAAMIDECEAMEARALTAEAALAKAVEALEPFAEAAASYDPDEGDGANVAWSHDFTIAALRRAREARARANGESHD